MFYCIHPAFYYLDPIPVLEQAVTQQQRLQQSQDHEIEVKQLRETLQEYNVEFAQVKNQECTIQKLREQLKEMEDRVEEMAAVSRYRGVHPPPQNNNNKKQQQKTNNNNKKKQTELQCHFALFKTLLGNFPAQITVSMYACICKCLKLSIIIVDSLYVMYVYISVGQGQ